MSAAKMGRKKFITVKTMSSFSIVVVGLLSYTRHGEFNCLKLMRLVMHFCYIFATSILMNLVVHVFQISTIKN